MTKVDYFRMKHPLIVFESNPLIFVEKTKFTFFDNCAIRVRHLQQEGLPEQQLVLRWYTSLSLTRILESVVAAMDVEENTGELNSSLLSKTRPGPLYPKNCSFVKS
jgi:hypothetical protein